MLNPTHEIPDRLVRKQVRHPGRRCVPPGCVARRLHAPCTLHPCTLHLAPCTLHPAPLHPCTRAPVHPCPLHLAPLHLVPRTLPPRTASAVHSPDRFRETAS